jgi:beta-galactosidase
VVLSLDHDQMGLGGASCGPGPMGEYVCRPEAVQFRVAFRPCGSGKPGDLAGVAREAIPVPLAPSVARAEDGTVTLASSPGATLRYRVGDGAEREYAAPFRLTRAATVTVTAQTGGDSALAATRTVALPEIVPVRALPRDGQKVLRASSYEPGEGYPGNALDGNPATFWHSAWSGGEAGGAAKHPHEIVLDLGGAGRALRGFEYLPRQGQSNGRIARYALYVSDRPDADGNGTPVAEGTFPNSAERQRVLFPAPAAGRYVRLVALSEVSGGPWASAAELTLLEPAD